MQKIDFSYDFNRKKMIVIYKNNLLIENRSEFQSYIDKSKLPADSIVCNDSCGRENVCNIEIPYVPQGSEIINKGNGVISLPVPSHFIGELGNVVNEFSSDCFKKIMGKTEIIPLKGYGIDNIIIDIKTALEKKRDICIIKDYQDYLDGKNIFSDGLDIAIYKYMSDEYCNIVIECVGKQSLSGLKKLTEKNLKKPEWL